MELIVKEEMTVKIFQFAISSTIEVNQKIKDNGKNIK
jgi:hypothetical protein